MTDSGAVPQGRPLCACHGEPMLRNGRKHGVQGWLCRRHRTTDARRTAHAEAQLRYTATAAGTASVTREVYARARRRLRARIERKRRQIKELEALLREEENTG